MKKKCLILGIIACLALSSCTIGQLKIGQPRSPMSLAKAKKKKANRFKDTTVIILPTATSAADSSSSDNK